MNKFTPTNQLSEIDKRISNAQAWNLAVEIMSGVGIQPVENRISHQDLKESLELWHDWFYDKLVKPWNEYEDIPNVVKKSSAPWAKDYKKIYHQNPKHEKALEEVEQGMIEDVPEGTPNPL